MMISRTPDPDYDYDYHYELVGGPLCGRTAEILGYDLLVATSPDTYGRYVRIEGSSRAYWIEGDDGAAPATPTPA
jgi:hypothetical protein